VARGRKRHPGIPVSVDEAVALLGSEPCPRPEALTEDPRWSEPTLWEALAEDEDGPSVGWEPDTMKEARGEA
jgi:hypothetical protein